MGIMPSQGVSESVVVQPSASSTGVLQPSGRDNTPSNAQGPTGSLPSQNARSKQDPTSIRKRSPRQVLVETSERSPGLCLYTSSLAGSRHHRHLLKPEAPSNVNLSSTRSSHPRTLALSDSTSWRYCTYRRGNVLIVPVGSSGGGGRGGSE